MKHLKQQVNIIDIFIRNSLGNMYVDYEHKKFLKILVKTNIYKQLYVHGTHTSKK